jgi:hypothetical protein
MDLSHPARAHVLLRGVIVVLAACATLLVSFGAAARPMESLRELERQLRLRPDQKAQFDVAAAATQRALVSSALSAVEFKERVGRELMRSRPDLAELFAAQEAMVEQNRPLFRAAREEWLRLYATLDEDQVRIAKAHVERLLLGVETLAESFRRYLGQFR